MKIIEAIKEFPLIVKRMNTNSDKIQQYASTTTLAEDLPFGDIEGQKKEVAALVQANNDLYERYMHLARSLAYTNTQVVVEVAGQKRSIVEWLHIRGAGHISPAASEAFMRTYQSLNTSTANQQLKQSSGRVDLTEKPLQAIRCYNQKEVDAKAAWFMDLRGLIDAKLEVVNATTDLMEVQQ